MSPRLAWELRGDEFSTIMPSIFSILVRKIIYLRVETQLDFHEERNTVTFNFF